MQFGEPLFANARFYLNNNPVEFAEKITYLGVEINNFNRKIQKCKQVDFLSIIFRTYAKWLKS
jgi:hypothetical protein